MLYFYLHQLNKKEDVENNMMIMFLPMPSGPTGPWVTGTKNVKERRIFAGALAILGLIAAALIIYIRMFVEKVGAFYEPKEPKTLMGLFLNDAGITPPLTVIVVIGVILISIAISAWVGTSEKAIARIAAIVFMLLQILVIISAYIPV